MLINERIAKRDQLNWLKTVGAYNPKIIDSFL